MTTNKKLILMGLFLCCSFSSFAQGSNNWVLNNANIIDVDNGQILLGQSLLIQDGKITAITDLNDFQAPAEVPVVDIANGYVIPGMFDMHIHFATNPSTYDALDKIKPKLAYLLKHGVTGIRDMAGDGRQLAFLSRQTRLDEIEAPDLYFSALMAGESFFDDPRTHASSAGLEPGNIAWMSAITDETNAENTVLKAQATGASGIKLYADLNAHQAERIIQAAKQHNFPVWGHAAVIPAMPGELVSAGITSLSHAPLLAWEIADKRPQSGKQRYADLTLDPNAPKFQQLLTSMVKQNVFLDATVTTFKGRDDDRIYQNGIAATKAAFEVGVKMVIGTDAAVNIDAEHPALIDEILDLHMQAKMTQLALLQAATINAAILLGIDDEVGRVQVGKRANLVVLGHNPLNDLDTLKAPLRVFKNGILIN